MADDLNTVAEKMAEAANAFLESLTDAGREKATLPIGDETERRRWYYTPNERAGLPLIEMAPLEQKAALKLLSTGLSEPAYNVATMVMGLENVLLSREGFNAATYPLRHGSTRFRDPSMYYFAVFGTPGDSSGWGWKIGGHHVSYQYMLKGDFVACTPAFFGSNPAVWPVPGGLKLRMLAPEEDLARALLAKLDADQRMQAIISPAAPTDIVQSNRSTIEDGALPLVAGAMMGRPRVESEDQARILLGMTPALDEVLRFSPRPKGLAASDMDEAQRDAFTKLVQLYISRVPEAVGAQYASQLEPGAMDGTAFAWAGPTDVGGPHYYRVQSDRMLIEYDNTQNGANHIHAVWRDRQLDFGGDVLAQHYAAAH
ncbi:MAG TPA: DUF3500 domain-containing protein [Dehalococcoidia bacterium]|nr:DUF3500 domain-containing protein [Dehalococcoidia bacterium]